jgi:Cu(I)/Ag(I) efflux system periplasmic protein CusF
MKILLPVLALTASLAVAAADNSGQRAGGPTGAQAAAAAPVQGTGVVKGMDPNGRVIIAHEPIPALKWPAMVMSFRITAELAKGLKEGQKVEFELQPKGDMDGTVTKVKVLP